MRTAAWALLPSAVFASVPALAFDQSDAQDAESAMLSAGSRAQRVRQLRNVPSVGVVDLHIRTQPRFRTNVPDISELRIMAERNAGGIARLRRALAANPVTRDYLESHGIDIGRVVGVKISSGGPLRLFVIWQ